MKMHLVLIHFKHKIFSAGLLDPDEMKENVYLELYVL